MAHAQNTEYVDAFLWEHLTAFAPTTKPALEAIVGSGNSSPELVVRGGMHDATVLSRLLVRTEPFTGLVVSIGVTAAANEDLLCSISNFIAELPHHPGFTCRTAKDEFLMIFPGDYGAGAHRRLSSIAEQLWDYQLRTVGSSPILFCWSAVDVKREPLVDAISAATEDMYQTRRMREAAFASSRNRRRMAV